MVDSESSLSGVSTVGEKVCSQASSSRLDPIWEIECYLGERLNAVWEIENYLGESECSSLPERGESRYSGQPEWTKVDLGKSPALASLSGPGTYWGGYS